MRILIIAALALACARTPKEQRKDASVTLTPVHASSTLDEPPAPGPKPNPKPKE